MALGDLPASVDFLLDYVMDQWCEESRPACIVKALCETHWPGRRFEIDEGDAEAGDGHGLYYLRDARDADTGEDAEELLSREIGRGEFPRRFRSLQPESPHACSWCQAGQQPDAGS